MRRLWLAEELVERWSLEPEELSLLPGKADTSKLGFAAQLAFYKQHARFPNAEADIAPAVIAYLAEQIGVPAAALAGYDWVGRSGRRQRQTILDFLPSGRLTRRRGHVPPLACDRGAAARAEPCSFGGGDRRVVRPRPCRADRRLSP